MQPEAEEFLRFAAGRGALRFGEFKTKSGRLSPYFFNLGDLCQGSDLARLAGFYARALIREFPGGLDIVFGPAYKGIPLAAACCMELHSAHGIATGYCFNRKEAKDHGEGGTLVGSIPRPGQRLVILDDVLTAGTSLRETVGWLRPLPGVKIMGLLIGLDRGERGQGAASARTEAERDLGLPVCAIAGVGDLLEMLKSGRLAAPAGTAERLAAYLAAYGA